MENLPLLSLIEGLTETTCECCGSVERDDVAELLLVEAIHMRAVWLEEQAAKRKAAWDEAERMSKALQEMAARAAG
jgi:hypothetical protein